MKPFLEPSEFIDWQSPRVLAKAGEVSAGLEGDFEIAKACFEFVRDHIKHSGDHQFNPVTLKASEVLKHATGYCYSKSHLLAALLRANGIPAALCYQRLTIEKDRPPFSLHGLNAIHLKEFGWYRVDPRGNKEGVDAGFEPPHEKLAFEIKNPGEVDFDGLFPQPLPEVVDVLTSWQDVGEVAKNLPDAKCIPCHYTF